MGHTSSSGTESRARRSDAARNRELILNAAAQVFAEEGADAAMESIAHRAGVGVGSIYRAFGSKTDLLHEIYRARLDELLQATDDAADHTDPVEAIRAYLDATIGFYGSNRLFTQIKNRVGLDLAWARGAHERRMRAVRRILSRAQQAGAVHPALTVPDLEFTLRSICHTAQDTGDAQEQWCRRIIPMLLLTESGDRAGEARSKLPRSVSQRAYDDWIFASLAEHRGQQPDSTPLD